MLKAHIMQGGLFLILFILCETAAAQYPFLRTCVVNEAFDSGDHTYIRCQEDNGQEYWIGVYPTKLSLGDRITFSDTPPMVNFKPKGLKHTFPLIYFVAGVIPSEKVFSKVQPTTAHVAPAENRPIPDYSDSVYSWQADDGSVVLTDDVSKIPNKQRENRFKQKRKPKFVMFEEENNYSLYGAKLKAFYDINNINYVSGHMMILVHVLLQEQRIDDGLYDKKEMYFDVDCKHQQALEVESVDAGETSLDAYSTKGFKKRANNEEVLFPELLLNAVCKEK